MNRKIYLMESGFYNQLISDRAEIMAVARSLGSAEEMRLAREDLMASISVINISPKTEEELKKSYSVDDSGWAHIAVIGELTPKAKTDACGGYTADALTEYGFIVAASNAADKDPGVVGLEYFVDSPGGYLSGLETAIGAVRAVSKPTRTRVGSMAASAAYWIAAETDEIIASTDLTHVGSIGVRAQQSDNTKKLENEGITIRTFTSTDAPDKWLNLSLDDDQKKFIASLDDVHKIFARDVAKGRGVTLEEVNKSFGRGGVLIAEKALKAKMIDSIETVSPRGEERLSDVIGSNTAAKAEDTEQEVKKVNNLDDLKKENSALYAEAVETGVKAERSRRNAISDTAAADPENEALQAICAKAIEDGTDPNNMAFQTKVNAAVRDGKKLDGENPPQVKTVVTEVVSLSAEDKEAAKLAGISEEEYAKLMKEAD